MNEAIRLEYNQGISNFEATPRSSDDVHAHICLGVVFGILGDVEGFPLPLNGPEAYLADG